MSIERRRIIIIFSHLNKIKSFESRILPHSCRDMTVVCSGAGLDCREANLVPALFNSNCCT